VRGLSASSKGRPAERGYSVIYSVAGNSSVARVEPVAEVRAGNADRYAKSFNPTVRYLR
jgi:hypothetical protein